MTTRRAARVIETLDWLGVPRVDGTIPSKGDHIMAATATVKTRATRTPSQFKPSCKVTVLVHNSASAPDATVAGIATLFEQSFSGLAVRAVHRTRAAGGVDKVPSLSVYLAPLGYEFAKPAAQGGVRLDSDVADVLFAAAGRMGLDTSNRSAAINAVSKALGEKMQGK
jgi:hypothetical protein